LLTHQRITSASPALLPPPSPPYLSGIYGKGLLADAFRAGRLHSAIEDSGRYTRTWRLTNAGACRSIPLQEPGVPEGVPLGVTSCLPYWRSPCNVRT